MTTKRRSKKAHHEVPRNHAAKKRKNANYRDRESRGMRGYLDRVETEGRLSDKEPEA